MPQAGGRWPKFDFVSSATTVIAYRDDFFFQKLKKSRVYGPEEARTNMRPMGLDVLLDITGKSSTHIFMYDKQMHQITPQITLNATTSKSPHLCFTGVTESQI